MSVKAAQSRGKVYFACLGHLKLVPKENNYIFLITRSQRKIEGIRPLKGLAPSQNLFNKYLKDWKNSDVDWFPIYKEQYLEELNYSLIDSLKAGLDSGKNVTLLCSCGDESPCHRSILKEIFTEMNYETYSY